MVPNYSMFLQEFRNASIPYDEVLPFLNTIKESICIPKWIDINEAMHDIMIAGIRPGNNSVFDKILRILHKTEDLSYDEQIQLIDKLIEDLKDN